MRDDLQVDLKADAEKALRSIEAAQASLERIFLEEAKYAWWARPLIALSIWIATACRGLANASDKVGTLALRHGFMTRTIGAKKWKRPFLADGDSASSAPLGAASAPGGEK